jgi:Cellulase (glycosyl hydrolase family 5)
VPNPNVATFQTLFKNTYAAGGRVVRWWFHTNGTVTPGYDSSGKAVKLPQSHIDGVKSILSAAHAAGVEINLSLWSFDMLQADAGNAHTNNQALLENDTNRQAYIDNYLTPLVNALKGTPGLYSWEIFNEPEGMGPNGWATYRTTEAFIQKTVNWFAGAIHTADPSALVTNAAVTFDYCSGVSGKNNYYSDSALRAAGGKQNGTLDYYEVHYYTSNGASNSAFTHSASSWKLDKKLVMGEFAAQATDGVALNDLYTNLYSNGYDGAWAWSYDADWPWPAMKVPMQNLYNAHADVGSCP